MNIDIELFVDDLKERIADFLSESERCLREELRGGVHFEDDLNGFKLIIEGNIFYIEHDTKNHRWHFRTEDYTEFFNVSEKKGEAIIAFLEAIAKITSPSAAAGGEENLVLGAQDPGAESEEFLEEGDSYD